MAEYIRARSDEHKEERLSQIKEATAELFASCPYSEITLTTIAEKLAGPVPIFINTLQQKKKSFWKSPQKK